MNIQGPSIKLSERSLQEGKLKQTLAQLQDEVRSSPRMRRCESFSFNSCASWASGRRPHAAPGACGLDPSSMMLARIFQPVISCEVFRQEVFAGKRTPLIFGEPLEWMGLLIQANQLASTGQIKAGLELRDRAFEAAPATPGKMGEQPFEWLADADQRLGPVLEVILEGRYFWVPFCRIKRIALDKPTDLRDMVWLPAQFVWSNGGEASGHIPTRYAGTALQEDDALRLSRKTDWRDLGEGLTAGYGQRILATDQAEFPLLECRTIDLATDSAGGHSDS